MIEQWKDIKGYEEYYQVSNLGRVKSLKFGRELILSSFLSNRTFLCVPLGLKNTTRKAFHVHRLVAEAFLDLPRNSKEMFVIHKNGDIKDNSLENLELITKEEKIKLKSQTRKKSCKNVSGITNISYDVINKAWAVLFKSRTLNICKHLGYFKDLEDAKVVREIYYNSLFLNIKPDVEYPGFIYLENEKYYYVSIFDEDNKIYFIGKFKNKQEAFSEWDFYNRIVNRIH
jgi:hypothetical protein